MNKLEEYCQWLVTYDSAILNLLKQESRSSGLQQALLSSGAPLHNSVIPKRIQYLLQGGAWLILLRDVLPSFLQEEGRVSVGKTAMPPVSPQLFVHYSRRKKPPKGVFAWAGQTSFLCFKHILLLYSFKMLMSCQHSTDWLFTRCSKLQFSQSHHDHLRSDLWDKTDCTQAPVFTNEGTLFQVLLVCLPSNSHSSM